MPAHPSIPAVTPFAVDLRVQRWGVDVPVLEGVTEEAALPPVDPPFEPIDGGWRASGSGYVVGGFTEPAVADVEAATRTVYRRLLAAAAGLRLARIWNYVPAINGAGALGLENYRAFSRARASVFEQGLGPGFSALLPAASAVGTDGPNLAVYFVATRFPVRHFENPEQVPAYEYPDEHGPRPPSFARATMVHDDRGKTTWFISGTAAIKGHRTECEDDLEGQIRVTLDNLRLMGAVSGAGEDLRRGIAEQRIFKVYLRHASDFPRTKQLLDTRLLFPGDRVSYLRSDICRSALLVEIEATLRA